MVEDVGAGVVVVVDVVVVDEVVVDEVVSVVQDADIVTDAVLHWKVDVYDY